MGIRELFKENLKYWRKNAGLTQEQLSEKIGYGNGYISEIESRNMFPKPETIDEIAAVLDIKASQLFEEHGCPKNLIHFDKKNFTTDLINGLYEKLNKSMTDYFEEHI